MPSRSRRQPDRARTGFGGQRRLDLARSSGGSARPASSPRLASPSVPPQRLLDQDPRQCRQSRREEEAVPQGAPPCLSRALRAELAGHCRRLPSPRTTRRDRRAGRAPGALCDKFIGRRCCSLQEHQELASTRRRVHTALTILLRSPGGTDGSNPASSSGESSANLTSSGSIFHFMTSRHPAAQSLSLARNSTAAVSACHAVPNNVYSQCV